MRKINKKFNRFGTTSHAIAKTKKPTTDRDTGKVANPVILNISPSTLETLRGKKNER